MFSYKVTQLEKHVLFVGDLWDGSTAVHRLNALVSFGFFVDTIDVTRKLKGVKGLFARILNKAKFAYDFTHDNIRVVDYIKSKNCDLVWIDKSTHITKDTLKTIKKVRPLCVLLGYSPDDMLNRNNQSIQFLNCLSYFDHYITTKSYNVHELISKGAKDVLFVGNAYEPSVHRPIELSSEEYNKYKADIGFIGFYEQDRYNKMMAVADAGFHIVITGKSWVNKCSHPNITIRPETLWGEEYAKVINATKINLCFLRKANRDLQTTRSIEIPACKGFMLGERTHEHLNLFEEGKEAEFFESDTEFIEKVDYYLKNPEKATAIAENGYARCINSGYSNSKRIERVFRHLQII